MSHGPTRKPPSPKNSEVGQLAIDLLAYAAMGAEEALQQRTLAASGADLGQVMIAWYQMCEAAVGSQAPVLARQTAQAFHKAMTDIAATADPEMKNQGIAYSTARGLLIDLAAYEPGRFVELWESTMHFDVDVITQTVALMLGFTRGVLDAVVGA